MLEKLLITLIFVLTFQYSFSQSAERRLGIELGGAINEYYGDLGSSLFFGRKPDYQGINYSLGYYLNPNIDICIFGNGGDLGFSAVLPNVIPEITNQSFKMNFATVNGGLRFKFLKDKAFTPFVMLGTGCVYLHTKVSRLPVAYTGAAGNLAGGFGFQFMPNDKFGFRLQSMFNYTFNDIWDGAPYRYMVHTRNKNNDLIASHSLSFFYNIPYEDAASSMSGSKMRDVINIK
jgi:hypothetical protein